MRPIVRRSSQLSHAAACPGIVRMPAEPLERTIVQPPGLIAILNERRAS
jgi:hypothetical protein